MRRLATLLLALWVGGCAVARFDVPGAADEAAYRGEHGYYAEYCALTQILKKPGFGADIRGQVGGHAVFYLNGACREPGYPVLRVCSPEDGVGLSMNAHFRNAKWVATPGRDFFFAGEVRRAVTHEAYRAVQREAQARGIYDGVVFHDEVFDAMPAGWAVRDWMYEMSVATDYGIALGRGRYCARVPVTPGQMAQMVAFLNEQNAPYRAGAPFRWSVFQDNCIHLAHNALAAAGLWAPWRTHRPLPIAVLDFPVPKNEFVNLMRRTNDEWLADPGAVYADVPARRMLLEHGRLPAWPGALAEAQGALTPNDVYDTGLSLIFYDEPLLGRYQPRFDRIFEEARYLESGANRAWFAARAAQAQRAMRPLDWWLAREPYRSDPAGFSLVYERYRAALAAASGARP